MCMSLRCLIRKAGHPANSLWRKSSRTEDTGASACATTANPSILLRPRRFWSCHASPCQPTLSGLFESPPPDGAMLCPARTPNCASAAVLLSRALLACLCFAANLTAADASAAKGIFTKRCTGCHTYGRGVKVGPDLKRVTDRRGRDWLVSFIRSSSNLIQSGDPAAALLYRKFNQERM